MGRDIDERWIEEAVERYQRLDGLLADFNKAVKDVEVCVRSPDGLVEILVTAEGSIRDVRIDSAFASRTAVQLAASVKAAVTAAADAAAWARQRLHADLFGEYRTMG